MKKQVDELKSLEVAAKGESSKLKERITLLIKNQNMLREHIKNAQDREEILEKELASVKGEDYEAQQTITMPELEEIETTTGSPAASKAQSKGPKKKGGRKKESKLTPVEEEGEVSDEMVTKPSDLGVSSAKTTPTPTH